MGPHEKRELAAILRHLARTPTDSSDTIHIYPSRDDELPSAYTAGLGNVLVAHQVIEGAPVFAVKLIYAIWVDTDEEEGT